MKRTKEIIVGAIDLTVLVALSLVWFVILTALALLPVFALAALFALTISASH